MDSQLQQQLADYLKQIAEAAKVGGSFALEQAPLVVRERILVGRVTETAWLVVGVALVLIAARAAVPFFAELAKPDPKEWPEWRARDNRLMRLGMTAGACGVFGVTSVAATFVPFVTVWFAPRLYILEWVMRLLK